MKEKLRERLKLTKDIKFNLLEVIIIMIITIIFGIVLGTLITTSKEYGGGIVKKSNNEISVFEDAYERIINEYYEDVNKTKLIDAAIKGMFDYLGDPYTTYMTEEETESLMERLNGEYAGVGMEITKNDDGKVKVVRVFKNSPANEIGVKTGDIILTIDGQELTSLSITEAANLIKGEAGTKVKIKILSNDAEKEIEVVRRVVNIDSVSYKTITANNQTIGYISVDLFAANTSKQFKEALEDLQKSNISGLVIDVRNNTGGYLDVVSEMASLFMDKSHIIYQLQTKDKIDKVYSTGQKNLDLKIAILINEVSASASEILASALNESYGALTVGTKSYGKGTVQKAITLDNGATLKYTIQKWLTPKGNWINETGITPTNYVELSADYTNNPIEANDNQLQEAVNLLTE